MTEQFRPRKQRGIVAVRADAGDTKKLLADLQKTFEDFKQANDEKIAEVQGGFDDVVKTEQVDRINNAVTELQTKIEEDAKAREEEQKRIDELELAIQRGNLAPGKAEDPEKVRAAAGRFFAGIENKSNPEVTDEQVEDYRQYRDAYATWLRVNPESKKGQEIRAAMSVGSDPDGGYWVPPEMSDRIIERLFETSPMRQISNVVAITTDSIKMMTDTNDATSGGWVGETASRAVTATEKVGETEIFVREQYASPKVTQKLLDMATIDVEGWLNTRIADKMARTENTAFVTGSGVDRPRGFADYSSAAVTTDDATRSWGVLQYVFTGASGGFAADPSVTGADDADPLITTISKLHPTYRAGARWCMNRSTEAAVRKLKDADGRYVVGFGDIRDGALGFSLFGFPITNLEDMADIGADSFSIAFGNFQVGYQIVDGRGIRVLRDPFTDKPYVIFYTTKWTGGDVVNFDAIKLVKFGTS